MPQDINTVAKKIIVEQGFATVNARQWFYTIGMGAVGRKDLIMPCTISEKIFKTLASKHYHGELVELGKFSISEHKIKTPVLGLENSRFELVEISEKDTGILKDQLCNSVDFPDFKGFLAVQPPDDDNRLFGEAETKWEEGVNSFLMSIVFKIGELKKNRELDEASHRRHVEKVLAQPVTPRNKRHKSTKKLVKQVYKKRR